MKVTQETIEKQYQIYRVGPIGVEIFEVTPYWCVVINRLEERRTPTSSPCLSRSIFYILTRVKIARLITINT